MKAKLKSIKKKHWILFSITFTLISLALLLWLTFEKTTETSYCASCHMMKPEYYTWQASSHNQLKCVQCHVEPEVNKQINYRLFMLKEWYAAITGDYGLMIQATSPIPDTTCTQCHNMDKRVVTPSVDLIIPHTKHSKMGINCVMCHTGVAHGNISKKRVTFRTDYATWDASIGKNIMSDAKNLRPDMDVCMQCHAVRKAPLSCSACHETSMIPKNHQPEKFKNGGHGKEASKDITYCDSCHSYMSTVSVEVSKGGKSTFQKFLSNGGSGGSSSTMPVKDYAKASTFCVDCHLKRPVTHNDNFQINHGSLARQDKNRCLTCHDNWPGSVVRYKSSAIISCGSCHPASHYRDAFRQSHPVPLLPNQRVTEYCYSCHSEEKCGRCHGYKKKTSTPEQ